MWLIKTHTQHPTSLRVPSPAQQGRKALAAELAALQAQHARQSAASQREARTLLDSRDSLQNEMSAARAATAEREAALHAEAEAHAREESRLQQELSSMQGAAAETEATLQQEIDSLAKEKARLQRDAKATQSDLARQLLTNVESHATEKGRLQRELDILHAAAVKTEADLRLEAQMQSDEQGKLQRELSGLAVKHKAAAQAAQTAQEQVRDLEEQLNDLQEEHAEEVAQLEQQVKDVKAELAEQLAAEVESQISLKGRMQQQLAALRAEHEAAVQRGTQAAQERDQAAQDARLAQEQLKEVEARLQRSIEGAQQKQRDLEERLQRTEQFADSTMASEAATKEQLTMSEKALTVSLLLYICSLMGFEARAASGCLQNVQMQNYRPVKGNWQTVFDDEWCSLQEERRSKDELKTMLAVAMLAEKDVGGKLTEVRAELAATESRLAKAEAALQVSQATRISHPDTYVRICTFLWDLPW